MATNKNITMKQYNGLDYDTLYPKTTPEQVGAVSYEVQTLTYTQQTQARTNINAAPGGFGLGGGAKVLAPADNLNDVWQAGWYAWDVAPQNAPTVGGSLVPYCSMNVLNKGGSYNMHQIVQTFEGYEIHRYYDGSKQTWSEWAWANPPMMAGVEYRTTERYNEKPVYAKMLNFGALPNSTSKSFTHGISSLGYVVDIYGQGVAGQDVKVSVDTTNITITSTSNLSAVTAYPVIKYTKTTG